MIVVYATFTDSPAYQTAGGGVMTALHPAPAPTAAPADLGSRRVGVSARTAPVEGSWALEHQPQAAAAARRIARTCTDAWQIGDDCAQSVLLVVSELVTNAVEHAQAPVTLHLYHTDCDERVWIGVSDGGPAPRDGTWTRSCTDNQHGLGLAVVEALSEINGTRTHLGGHTTHWARLNPTAT
uniref:ATP-binding protein n=1 Tax=Kitasatospora indigofera TaxID=67307 RepID=UPI002F919AFE